MSFPIISDSSPEIETWKMSVTLVCAILAAGVTVWNVFLSREMKHKEQHYGAQIDKALQDHKAELDRKAKEYEIKLQYFAFENQTRFSQLHVKRVEIIAALYKLIAALYERVSFLAFFAGVTGADNDANPNVPHLSGEIQHLIRYFREHRIYFLPKLIKLFYEMTQNMKTIDFVHVSSIQKAADLTAEELSNLQGALQNIDKVKAEMEREFRILLGVSKPEDKDDYYEEEHAFIVHEDDLKGIEP